MPHKKRPNRIVTLKTVVSQFQGQAFGLLASQYDEGHTDEQQTEDHIDHTPVITVLKSPEVAISLLKLVLSAGHSHQSGYQFPPRDIP